MLQHRHNAYNIRLIPSIVFTGYGILYKAKIGNRLVEVVAEAGKRASVSYGLDHSDIALIFLIYLEHFKLPIAQSPFQRICVCVLKIESKTPTSKINPMGSVCRPMDSGPQGSEFCFGPIGYS